MPSAVSRRKREEVSRRAKYYCEYCCSPEFYAPQRFTVEHIQPRAKQGNDELDNLALAGQGCNGFKGTLVEAVDRLTSATTPLFNPRIHIWADHFAWSNDYSEVLGLTSVGRATVDALQLNRDNLRNQRLLLVSVSRHPRQIEETSCSNEDE